LVQVSKSRQRLGRWGESLADDYLRERGYVIVARNFRTPYGEIDLVACQEVYDPGADSGSSMVMVFVEVKTRASGTFGYPEESITARKREHLLASAQAYIQQHPDAPGDWRIDVIAIRRYKSGKAPSIVHFENAVQ
jgi:putative endonuclease